MIKSIYKFYSEVKQEARRIIWPSRKDLISTTIVVLVVIFLLSLCGLFLDFIIHKVITFLLNLGK
ncbi:SecE [Candidatus Phycorickettsia trachydisci]|uniref:Protein translocase subunit SecE n=1 Tax=Candidatus Phycorickettsia trachydisci TaxID=2115978 RepID=A0A2P1PA96_9RICK|nr:preprotein translocase subunit SecE [Candidatus Phycorickettsia trachydisci]AVP88166.1 SecE [Candidatus Phycorickettsia trachydisci]